jgi:hypothetical protein
VVSDVVQHLRDASEILTDYKWAHITLDPSVLAMICRMAANEIENLRAAQALPRMTDPATSRKAAENIKVRSGSQRHTLLVAYGDHGSLTDEEAGEITGLRRPGVCYWKRCSELRAAGYIEPTGQTRLSSVGEAQMVCRLTDLGRGVLGVKQLA